MTGQPPSPPASASADSATSVQPDPSSGRPSLPYGALPGVVSPIAIVPSQVQQSVQFWQGQFPPPDAIERYENVLPGSFNRLMAMAESLQAAQIADVQKALDYTRDDTRRGHWLGFLTTLTAIIGAIGIAVASIARASTGGFVVASALLSVPVMAVAKALIDSARQPAAPRPHSAAPNPQAVTMAPSQPHAIQQSGPPE